MLGKQLKQRLGRLGRDTSGNVAMITALAIIPIIAIAGVAVDLQATMSMKNKAQLVIDSAVLAGAKSKQAGLTNKEIRKDVRRYVRQIMKNEGGGLSCDNAKIKFVSGAEDIIGTVKCFKDTSFTQILGRDSIEFNVAATSTYGISKVDVAFIFDNSGSMGWDNRMSKLKDSAETAVDVLLPEDWQTNTDVRIAIAPYNHAVNAGDYFDDVTAETQRFAIESSEDVGDMYESDILGKVQTDMLNLRKRFFDYETVVCTYWRYGYCYDYVDTAARKSFESSCVYARTGANRYTNEDPDGSGDHISAGSPIWDYRNNYDESNQWRDYSAKSSGASEVMHGGANSQRGSFDPGYIECPDTAVQPLTNNRGTLISTINNMQPDGGTAGHLGLAWAYYMISPEWNDVWPTASEAMEWDEPDAVKAIILMTDGDFLNNHPTTGVNSTNQAAAICDSIKANTNKNILIYTIGFQVPSNVQKIGGKTILEYCASKPEFAFDASSGEQLTDAYTAIASSISELRIKN
jgi:Flp pilus assembly protein TadG